MAKTKERAKAITLRQQGQSIGAIAAQLHVSKSTVSGWCRDIALSPAALEKIAKQSKAKSTAALLHYSETKRRARQKAIESSHVEGVRRLGKLSERDIYCLGLGLYWGEGYKKGSQEFGFTNSDPQMVKFYLYWLQVVFGVTKQNLIFRISINTAHKERLDEVHHFWIQLLGVDEEQFTKASLIKTKAKKNYTNGSVHMGTLRVKVRQGTAMRREIIGAIQSIAL